MLTYCSERLDEKLKAEMISGQDEYYKEVAEAFHNFPIDVDWNAYFSLQEVGALHIITGRDGKQLKAIAVVVIAPEPHFACITASLTLLYINPKYRGAGEAIRLLITVKDAARESGAHILILQQFKGNTGKCTAILLNGKKPVFKGDLKCLLQYP